ncbi:MAG TPA: hypothetical protein VFC78_22630 [Tepidisphaeraceae bacterium]|nr:hypothetical protein [Tepidisphaeraceae bacterium]
MADSPAQPNPPASAAFPSPKRKKKRWVLRTLAVVVILLLLVALVVQIVLWTDLPRGLVVGQLEKQLGLRVSAGSLSTGWLGHTHLKNVTLGLPLSKKAFLNVPTMDVRNTSLLGILIGRPVSVQSIELDNPHLYVLQDKAGRWNLQDVAELLQRVVGKKTAQQAASPALPIVKLANGIVTITDNKGRGTDVEPLSVYGRPDSAVEWKYDVNISKRVAITGRLVPGGNWAHEVALQVQDIGAWTKPWVKDFPAVVIDVDWRGALSTGGVGGRLDINKFDLGFKAGAIRASGALAASFDGATLGIHPDNLNIEARQFAADAGTTNTSQASSAASSSAASSSPVTSQKQDARLLKATLASGLLTFGSVTRQIKAQPVLIDLFGGPLTVSADYDLNTQSGQINAAWNQLALPGQITHSGKFSATLRKPFPNRIVVDGTVNSDGNTPTGPWIADAKFGATGASFVDFDWHVNTGKFEWLRRGEGVDLNGLALSGALRDQTLTLRSISLPRQGLLQGDGSYHFAGNHAWFANLRGQHWPFHPIEGTQLAFELKSRGDSKIITLDDFILKSPDVRFSANGTYRLGEPKPLNLQITIKNAPPTAAPAAVASSPQAKILNGTIEGHANLVGTVSPLNLSMKGNLTGREIDIRGHHLGDVNLQLSNQSRIDDNGVFVYTRQLKLLRGEWSIDGIYVFNSDGLNIDVGVNGLSLADAATLAGQSGLAGALDGQMSIFVPGLNPRPSHLKVPPASFKVHNVNARGVLIDEIDATVALDEGNLRIMPIRMKRGKGSGDARLALNIGDIRRIDVGATLAAWPVDIPGANAHADAWVGIPDAVVLLPDAKSVNPAARKLRITARQIDLHASTSFKGDAVGQVIAHAGIYERTVDLRSFNMRLLGGRVDGQAVASLDDLLGAKGEFTWERLDLQKLALSFPVLKDLSGRVTGDARLAPATVPRPREPLALVITSTIENGKWRTVPIKDLRVAAYLGPNADDPEAGCRVVMEDSATEPSFVHLADGTVQLWGRFGSHRAGMTSTQGQFSFKNLELDDLVHAFMPKAATMPGKLSGNLMLLRSPKPVALPARLAMAKMFPAPPVQPLSPDKSPGADAPLLEQLIQPLYGEGKVSIANADLGNFGPIAALYNFMHFQGGAVPEGRGSAQFHLERGTFTVERMRYFNRGTEIRAIAAVKQIWNIPNSPFTASGLGTAQPLAKVKLPFLADFGGALNAIQSSLKLTGVRVEGTLANYSIVGPLGLTDVGDELQHLLVGEVKADTAGGAGG